MRLFDPFKRRFFGFRVLELGATVVLTAMVLTVYMAKTGAGDKRDDIDHIQQQIQDSQGQIRLLKAEVASEEQPERLAALAGQYLKMEPISAKHEIDPEALADVAQAAQAAKPAAAKAAAPTPTAAQASAPAAAMAVKPPTTADH